MFIYLVYNFLVLSCLLFLQGPREDLAVLLTQIERIAAPVLAVSAFLYLGRGLARPYKERSFLGRLQSFWPYFLSLPILLYLWFFSASAYTGLFLQDQDFTNISSALNHTAHFQGLLRTGFLETGAQGSYLGHHFAPLLLAYVPFYFLADHYPALFAALQPLPASFPTHFLYASLLWLTLLLGLLLWMQVLRSILQNAFVRNIAWALLLMQPLLWRLIASFHFEILVLPASGILFWGLHKKRLLLFGLGAFLMLLIKEDIGIYLSFFGIYLFLHKGYGKTHIWGAWLFAFCLFYFLLAKGILLPYFSGGEAIAWESYWTKEAAVPIPSLWKPSWSILLAVGFLVLLNLRYFVFVLLPILLLHAFSHHLFHQGFLGHYSYTILPFLFYGILLGARRILAIASRIERPRLPAIALAIAVFFCMQANASDRLFPIPFLPKKTEVNKIEAQLQKLARKYPGACVEAPPNFTPHLPLRLRALPLQIPCRNFYALFNPKCKGKKEFLEVQLQSAQACSHRIRILAKGTTEIRIIPVLSVPTKGPWL